MRARTPAGHFALWSIGTVAIVAVVALVIRALLHAAA